MNFAIFDGHSEFFEFSGQKSKLFLARKFELSLFFRQKSSILPGKFKMNFSSKLKNTKFQTIIFAVFRRENSNIHNFIPSKMVNFAKKIQIDYFSFILIKLNFRSKNESFGTVWEVFLSANLI